MEYILNPPEDLEDISTTGDSEIARYVIDVNTGNVKKVNFQIMSKVTL